MTEAADTAPTTTGQHTAKGVTFHYAHRVLKDFALDLASGLSQPLSSPVDVFVGIHLIPHPPQTGRLRVGIQTEQMLDQTGKRMWRVPMRPERLAYAQTYDVVLDLSPDNRKAYRFLPIGLRRKIRFGPHVFPDHRLEARFVDAPPLFIGWRNERRHRILDRLRAERPVATLATKVFGADLARVLAGHGAVLNIHFQNGVYSEVPRFLKACLAGKPVLSEPMAQPLVEGLHYLPLDAHPTPETIEAVFAALRALAAEYQFRGFLESLLGGKGTS